MTTSTRSDHAPSTSRALMPSSSIRMKRMPRRPSRSSMLRTTAAKRLASSGAREAGNLIPKLSAKLEIDLEETTVEVVEETVAEAETIRAASTAVNLVTLPETAEPREGPEADQTIAEDTEEENLPEGETTAGTDLEETTETAEEETTPETRGEEAILTRRDPQVADHLLEDLQEDPQAREEKRLTASPRESRASNDYTYDPSTSKVSS